MRIYYAPEYNIDIPLLERLHPFDGGKFRKVFDAVRCVPGVEPVAPSRPVEDPTINTFVDDLMRRLLKNKRYVLGALEVPYIQTPWRVACCRRIGWFQC